MVPLSPQETAGLQFLCGDSAAAREVIDQVISRQRGSAARHSRALAALSGAPSMLSFEAPLLPLCVERAAGGRIVDVDGNDYVDCHMGYTAGVLGHNPPTVRKAVAEALERGLGGGHFFEEQTALAELVLELVPGVERVAFFHTGGEAVNAAVRFARSARRRQQVAKFEGCYHGSNEVGLHNTWMILAGRLPSGPIEQIPPHAATGGIRTSEDFLILPYNSPVALEKIRRHAGELACVVVDPLPQFMSKWSDDARSFLGDLADVTAEAEVPLVLDEVVCGFRLARGGAREWAGVAAQISCYGKITSGLGIPLSIVGGEAAFLDTARTDGIFRDYASGKAWVASTLSSNFLAVVAALAQLRLLAESHDELMGRLDRHHGHLRERLADFARRSGIPVSLAGHPRTHVQLVVGGDEPPEKSYRSVMGGASLGQMRMMMLMTFYLRLYGVYTKVVPTMNLSAGHTEEDIEQLVAGIENSLTRMERDGMLQLG